MSLFIKSKIKRYTSKQNFEVSIDNNTSIRLTYVRIYNKYNILELIQ